MYSNYKFLKKGIGLISTQRITKGVTVGTYMQKGIPLVEDCVKINDGWVETYPLGRFLNHSTSPNLDFNILNSKVILIASRNINKNEELLVNYLSLKKLLNIPDKIIDVHKVRNFTEDREKIISTSDHVSLL